MVGTLLSTSLRSNVNVAVIALWLGHADMRSTDAYVHADLGIKERALAMTTPCLRSLGMRMWGPGCVIDGADGV